MTRNYQKVKFRRPHPGQQPIFESEARFIVAACGRRFGKSCFIPTMRRELLWRGLPGAYFAPTYKNLKKYWRETKELLRPAILQTNEQEHRLVLKNGASYEMWSLDNPDNIRGQAYAWVDIDECAVVPDLEYAWNKVIRPFLVDYRGKAGFWSTPNGLNYFHTLFTRGRDPAYENWESFQAPTSVNPYIHPDEIEEARRDSPQEDFRQEYLAEFIQGEGAVFRNIQACLTDEETKPEKHKGHTLVAGVDWGQVNDFTAISVGCMDCRREVHLDRFNQIDWHFQRQRLISAFEKWHVSYAEVEENSIGSPNLEELQRQVTINVKGFQTTAQSKPQIIQSLALCFEKEEMQFIDIPIATRELEAYEAKKSAITGRIQYSAPEGMHDDTVIARALMLQAVQNQRVSGATTFRFKVI